MTRLLAPLLALVFVLSLAAANVGAQDPARGEAIAKGCKCHGTEFYGEEPGEIVEQLMAFKQGKRFNKIMQKKAEGLSEQDMQDVAAWFASQSK